MPAPNDRTMPVAEAMERLDVGYWALLVLVHQDQLKITHVRAADIERIERDRSATARLDVDRRLARRNRPPLQGRP